MNKENNKQAEEEFVVVLLEPLIYNGVTIPRKSIDYTGVFPINVNQDTKVISFEPREFTEKFNGLNTSISSINQTLNTNSTNIVDLESKHNQQQNEINNLKTKLDTKQDIISVGTGLELLNNLISIQQSLLDKWNGYQQSIQNNESNIEKNNDAIDTLKNEILEVNKSIQQIIEGLQKFPIFEIVGDWVNGTTYRKNQAVYHNKSLWNSKIDNNTKEPTVENVDAWFLISTFDIPLNEYLSKTEAQTLLSKKQDILSGSNGVVVSQENKQVSIEPQLLAKWNGYESLIQTNQSEIVKTNNNVDVISQKTTQLQTQIEQLTTTINEQQAYINLLKTRILIKDDSTNLVAPNGTSQISIANDNAFKNITGDWEPLASDTWVQEQLGNYYTITDLTNRSVTLTLRELNVGRWSTANHRFYSYSTNQCIYHTNADTNWWIGTGDKRFGQPRSNSNFQNRN